MPVAKRQKSNAKAQRRQRIVDAARALIRESGEAGLSMRAIAARAEVSHATPYNLFGSKRAIIMALLDDVRDFEKAFQQTASVTALDQIFQALDLTFAYFREEPDFYRTVWACLLDIESSPKLRAELTPPQSDKFWVALLSSAIEQGHLPRERDVSRLQNELAKCFSANMLQWVRGAISSDELYTETAYGYALLLIGAANAHGRAILSDRLQT